MFKEYCDITSIMSCQRFKQTEPFLFHFIRSKLKNNCCNLTNNEKPQSNALRINLHLILLPLARTQGNHNRTIKTFIFSGLDFDESIYFLTYKIVVSNGQVIDYNSYLPSTVTYALLKIQLKMVHRSRTNNRIKNKVLHHCRFVFSK